MNLNQNNYTQPLQQQNRIINVILVSNINDADNYPINPNTSVMFLSESMKDFKMRSRDSNGFPLPERTWELTETTPTPQLNGQYATRDELKGIEAKIDKVISTLDELIK